eukprot:1161670-Pelagomonas_calceolata.AAC.9
MAKGDLPKPFTCSGVFFPGSSFHVDTKLPPPPAIACRGGAKRLCGGVTLACGRPDRVKSTEGKNPVSECSRRAPGGRQCKRLVCKASLCTRGAALAGGHHNKVTKFIYLGKK